VVSFALISAPSSVLRCTKTCRPSSGSAPRATEISIASAPFWTVIRTMSPEAGSIIGTGLPQVLPAAVETTCRGSQIRPASSERRSTTSISPASAAELSRPSQKASSSEPRPTIEGIRNV
jgi:hypothetical protein